LDDESLELAQKARGVINGSASNDSSNISEDIAHRCEEYQPVDGSVEFFRAEKRDCYKSTSCQREGRADSFDSGEVREIVRGEIVSKHRENLVG